MELPPELVERLLDEWPVARLGSTRPGGGPHQVPIVFARTQGVLFTPIDGKPKSGRELARTRNLRAHPEVSLLLDHYDEDWRWLWWLRIDGRARVLTPADPENDPEAAPALAALRRKYPQYRDTPILTQNPTLIAIHPHTRNSWCSSPDHLP